MARDLKPNFKHFQTFLEWFMHRIRLRSHGDPVICKLPKAHSQGTKKTKREIAVQQTFSLKGTRCSGAFTCRLSFSYQASELDKSTKIMSSTSTSSKLVRSNLFTILSYYTTSSTTTAQGKVTCFHSHVHQIQRKKHRKLTWKLCNP